MVESPFAPAQQTKRRLKLLMYGPPKSGKTVTALGLPKPVVIDLEHGTDAYADRFEFDVLHTVSAEELKAAIEWLAENKGQYETVIIDPITVWYEALQQVRYDIKEHKLQGANKPADDPELLFGDWKKIKLQWNVVCARLVNAGYHLVAIARQAWEYDGQGQNLHRVGFKPGAETGASYWFDTIVRLEGTNGKRLAHIEGDRWDIMQGEHLVPLDDFVKAIQAHAEATLDAPIVPEPDPEEARERDVQAAAEAEAPPTREERASESAPPAQAASQKASSPVTEVRVPCPEQGCSGYIMRKRNSKTGEYFYSCSAWKGGCKAKMDEATFEAASKKVADDKKKAAEAATETWELPTSVGKAAWKSLLKQSALRLKLSDAEVIEVSTAAGAADPYNADPTVRRLILTRMEEKSADNRDPFANQ